MDDEEDDVDEDDEEEEEDEDEPPEESEPESPVLVPADVLSPLPVAAGAFLLVLERLSVL